MSYVALATDRYDEVVRFYGELCGFPVLDEWDRPDARGVWFELGGMRLEILDNQRKRIPSGQKSRTTCRLWKMACAWCV